MTARANQFWRAWDHFTCAVAGHVWSDWWERASPSIDISGETVTRYLEVRSCARCLHMVSRSPTGTAAALTLDALGADLVARVDAALVEDVRHQRYKRMFDESWWAAKGEALPGYKDEELREGLEKAEALVRQFRESTAAATTAPNTAPSIALHPGAGGVGGKQ